MKNKTYNIYSHEKCNPEAELIFICSCYSLEGARYVLSALEFKDKGGNEDNVGIYNYYIKSE